MTPQIHEKIIRDPVLGYINLLPDDLRIVDTDIFQRLKRIKQLTAFALYPSANQTRFEHSLGVMHLGSRVLENLQENGDIEPILEATRLSKDCLQHTVRYACLLHDVGHAAFSHVGEAFYEREEMLSSIRCQDSAVWTAIGGERASASSHELMSCLVVLKHFRSLLPEPIDIGLLCRMICKGEYDHFADKEASRVNPVIHILNSTYDVDRLDYVLRDSFSTGTLGVSVDYERILRGYAIRNETLLFLRKALPSVVSLVTGRDFLHQWLYNHHTVAYTDLLIELILNDHFSRDAQVAATLFSIDAVEAGVCDSDVWVLLKQCERDGSTLASRLLNRKFHKALWKTRYDFDACQDLPPQRKKHLLDKCRPEQGRRVDIQQTEAFRKTLVDIMAVEDEDILISMRSVKHFDPTTNREISFWVQETQREYKDVATGSAFDIGRTEYPLVHYAPEKVNELKLLNVLAGIDIVRSA